MQDHRTAKPESADQSGRRHLLSRRTIFTGLAVACAVCATSAISGNRDLSVQFAAVTPFSGHSFSGDWYEIARVLKNARDTPPQLKIRYDHDQKSGHLIKSIVGGAGIDPAQFKPSKGAVFEEFKPGQMRLVGERNSPVTWVIWVDKDYQTAVLAQKSGAQTVVLARSPLAAPGRLAKAIRILEQYGYDLSKLRLIGP